MRQITPLSLISVLANLKGGTMVYANAYLNPYFK